MKPKIGIILLNWNNWQDTLSCLGDIRGFSYPQELIEIIVVDNDSQDESITQLQIQPDIELIALDKNTGFAGGNNVGIQRCLEHGCDFILLLNNDTKSPSNLLQPLLDVFNDKPTAGIISPKIYYMDPPNTLWYAGGRFKNPRIIGDLVGIDEFDTGQYDQMREVDYATGCCMLVQRKVFQHIGLLDDNFFFYHEDVDFCYRAKLAGFSVWYQPEISIVHNISKSTTDNLPHRTYLYAQARVIFLSKHIRGFKIPWVVSLEIIRLFRRVFAGIRQRNMQLSSSYIQGILAGIKSAYEVQIKEQKESDTR